MRHDTVPATIHVVVERAREHGHSAPFHSSEDAILHLLGESDNFLRRLGVSAPEARFHVILLDVAEGPQALIHRFIDVLSKICENEIDVDCSNVVTTNVSMAPPAIELLRLANETLLTNVGSKAAQSNRSMREVIESLAQMAHAADLLRPVDVSLSNMALRRLEDARALFLKNLDELIVQGRANVYGQREVL